ncbi:hypothetical protein HK098_000821 [Nowakowskiella sp. JEL0407]|nr:hypothetical protein HK098_000821 [Nowakowskiella sp. JEL0407]
MSLRNHTTPNRCISPQSPAKITGIDDAQLDRQLSSDDLSSCDFPDDRQYLIFPNEKYHYHKKLFTPDSTQTHQPKPTCPINHTNNGPEQMLNLFYRAGHISELKKRQFGKVYLANRKEFAEKERRGVSLRASKKKHQNEKPSPIESMNQKPPNITVYAELAKDYTHSSNPTVKIKHSIIKEAKSQSYIDTKNRDYKRNPDLKIDPYAEYNAMKYCDVRDKGYFGVDEDCDKEVEEVRSVRVFKSKIPVPKKKR